MTEKKKSTLKARGIRFSDTVWEKLLKEADGKCSTPSNVVRGIVDAYYFRLEQESKPL